MMSLPVIVIFDVGKTNKKMVLFNDAYQLVAEHSVQLPQATDEDGDECEDIGLLTQWIRNAFEEIMANAAYDVRAVNFSAYGASFVHLGTDHRPVTPLYNYLKPFSEKLKQQFYDTYGGEETLSMETASPVLGNLNSGMQLYRLKWEHPELYAQVAFSLHLPQYLSYLVCKGLYSDMTSIGCHTGLWDFVHHDYHRWVYAEEIDRKLAPVCKGDDATTLEYPDKQLAVGVGLHDSSAALIPYLAGFNEPFILISTGTWCISLNPFNQSPLTAEELAADCLCYITYEGNPVKASRLFAGYEHEAQTKRLAAHFGTPADHYKTVTYDPAIMAGAGNTTRDAASEARKAGALVEHSVFGSRELGQYASYQEAYHQFIADLITQQVASTALVLKNSQVKHLFVDGGFGRNPVYMHMLAAAFPGIKVFAASVAQATALGAALAIHRHWNTHPLPEGMIALKQYS